MQPPFLPGGVSGGAVYESPSATYVPLAGFNPERAAGATAQAVAAASASPADASTGHAGTVSALRRPTTRSSIMF
ncbi:MAG TPA: hypothetical protein VFQ44_17550 [Streptosporangiaceae bacterium]|nr:hypothetical protein [Streptosporangiaceae bacterium]